MSQEFELTGYNGVLEVCEKNLSPDILLYIIVVNDGSKIQGDAIF